MWLGYVAAWHVPGSFVIGLLVPSRWYLSVLAGWGVVLMSVLSIYSSIYSLIHSINYYVTRFVPLLMLILGAGYLGALLARWLGRWRRRGTGDVLSATDDRASL
jgi:hypothetical protein